MNFSPTPLPIEDKLGDLAAAAGLRRIRIVAWRDLDHPEAGGSEVHAARIAERWAAAGIDITLTASRAPGAERDTWRDGYRVRRLAGRYTIFPANAAVAVARWKDRPDGTVEIWNGMPFFSPLWSAHPRAVFIHHVHGDMWQSVLPRTLASMGRFVERRVAPPLYRSTPVVTLSDSSRQVIIDSLGFDPSRVTVVPPGVDETFCPGSNRSADPLVVAVGRLVPYKRFDQLIEVLVSLRQRHPRLRAIIAGEGTERAALEGLVHRNGASAWISMPGRLDDDSLLELYQNAWVLLSASAYEGWGLTITEAAACATPSVVSPIVGHVDALDHGISGLLAEPGAEMVEAVHSILSNELLRKRLQRGAWKRAQSLNWDRTALETFRVLASECRGDSAQIPM
jgi:glycosyltransferase involved in cell wall biosynthesis